MRFTIYFTIKFTAVLLSVTSFRRFSDAKIAPDFGGLVGHFLRSKCDSDANWVPLDTVAEDAPLVRTNHDESEDGSNSAVLCTSVPLQGTIGIAGGGRRLGFLLPNGKCKTVGRKNQVKEIGEGIMVLLSGPKGPTPEALQAMASCLEDGGTEGLTMKLAACASKLLPGEFSTEPDNGKIKIISVEREDICEICPQE